MDEYDDSDPEILIDKDDLLYHLKNSKVLNSVITKPNLISYTLYPFIALAIILALVLAIIALSIWGIVIFIFTVIWFTFVGPIVLVNKIYSNILSKKEDLISE